MRNALTGNNGKKARSVLAAGVVSLAAFAGLQLIAPSTLQRNTVAMARAARIMEEAMSDVRNRRAATVLDPSLDPNRTGLIGPEYSPIMTTLGELAAKRSTTNPNIAGLVARLLDEAGVRAGDTVAIGSSGSFPALLVASLAAVKAMNAHAVCILSLGASSYGATDPDFTLLEIYSILQQSGICSTPPAGVSLGGEKDIGLDLEPAAREALVRRIAGLGIPLVYEPDLAQNVAKRITLYRRNAGGRVSAFINCGGGFANLGTSSLGLKLRPGLNAQVELPPKDARGILFEMAAAGTPVIHLLYIKGLTQKYGLPWDPIPLPHAEGAEQSPARPVGFLFWVVCIAYFGLLLGLLAPSGLHGSLSKIRHK